MKTRLTLKPGQNGTKKLLRKYGGRLVAVRVAAKNVGARWHQEHKPWEMPLGVVYAMGLNLRIVR